jgi:dihydrodipicolinate synthase/N-acetylneuraminate lyase
MATFAGTGLPLVTPFTPEGDLDAAALADLVGWVQERGVDFIVPCGSTSEAPLMSTEERTRAVETVADAADVPVMAGTGQPSLTRTLATTEAAAEAGADAALVVTPYYYSHGQASLADYYRELADDSPIPVYLYSVPAYTDTRIAPETVAELADHPNVHGMKDSTGDIGNLTRTVGMTADADFDVFVGSGSVYAAALGAGAAGGIVAVANAVPEVASAVYERFGAGEEAAARELNAALVELDHAGTTVHGVPGMKAAMRGRGAPAGHARQPFDSVDAATSERFDALVEAALAAL